MKEQMMLELCESGTQADHQFSQGNFTDALKKYQAIIGKCSTTTADSYLAGKATLGLLITNIKLGQFKAAMEIWNSPQGSIHGVGIRSLEGAQTTVQDMIVYDFVCAYLHSLSVCPKTDAARAVNQYMSRICEHAIDEGNRSLLRLALSNWKQHLSEIYKASLPKNVVTPLMDYEKQYGEVVRLSHIDFPELEEWNKPQDFCEFSKTGNITPLGRKQNSQKTKFAAGRSFTQDRGGVARKVKSRS